MRNQHDFGSKTPCQHMNYKEVVARSMSGIYVKKEV
jgi:hypothetical protein